MALWGKTDAAASKPKYLTTAEKNDTYGVDLAESQTSRSDGSPAAPGWVRRVVKKGYVKDIIFGASGSNYPDGTGALLFSGGGGTGAAGYAVAEGGEIIDGVLTSPGTDYTSAPTITVQQIIQRGYVTGVAITTPGTGYDNATGIPMAISGGGGTGAAGYLTVSGGVVTATTITASGSGYTFAPTVSFVSGTGGTGAALTSLLGPTGAGTATGAGGGLTVVMSDSMGRKLTETLVEMSSMGGDTGGGDDTVFPDS